MGQCCAAREEKTKAALGLKLDETAKLEFPLNTSGLEEDDSIKFSGRDIKDSDSLRDSIKTLEAEDRDSFKTLEVDDSEPQY